MAEIKHRYMPPSAVAMAPKRSEVQEDIYSGTKAELVAAGLVPAELLPGEAGMPLMRVTLWPVDSQARYSSEWTPGRLVIHKTPSGNFTARLSVSSEERRIREETAERARQEEAERNASASLAALVRQLGPAEVRRRLDDLLTAPADSSSQRGACQRVAPGLRLAWSAPRA